MRFIPRVYETTHYLYFFGSEVNPQYSYINSMTRQSYQSFMIRVCKNDPGANYTAKKDSEEIRELRKTLKNLKSSWTDMSNADTDETAYSYSSEGWGDTYQLPTKLFTSAIKFPFGCYLKRYDGAQSLNVFWGQQNIIYFNRLGKSSFTNNLLSYFFIRYFMFIKKQLHIFESQKQDYCTGVPRLHGRRSFGHLPLSGKPCSAILR